MSTTLLRTAAAALVAATLLPAASFAQSGDRASPNFNPYAGRDQACTQLELSVGPAGRRVRQAHPVRGRQAEDGQGQRQLSPAPVKRGRNRPLFTSFLRPHLFRARLNGTVLWKPGAGPGRPYVGDADAVEVRGRKADQLMRGARKVFMERGYEGASVDEIAKAAGASKATLYSYFPDKRQLFEAVVQAGCHRQGDMVLGRIDADEPIEVALRRISREFACFVLSPGALEMFRTCIAESGRFPELGRAFYASGPGRVRAQLIAFLDSAVQRGELVIEDTALAADQFAALCKARIFLWSLLGCDKPPAEAEHRHAGRRGGAHLPRPLRPYSGRRCRRCGWRVRRASSARRNFARVRRPVSRGA